MRQHALPALARFAEPRTDPTSDSSNGGSDPPGASRKTDGRRDEWVSPSEEATVKRGHHGRLHWAIERSIRKRNAHHSIGCGNQERPSLIVRMGRKYVESSRVHERAVGARGAPCGDTDAGERSRDEKDGSLAFQPDPQIEVLNGGPVRTVVEPQIWDGISTNDHGRRCDRPCRQNLRSLDDTSRLTAIRPCGGCFECVESSAYRDGGAVRPQRLDLSAELARVPEVIIVHERHQILGASCEAHVPAGSDRVDLERG